MSSCSSFLELSDQLCYVHCGFCSTILLVSVPLSSLSKVVTVRCGHCQGLLSVDMRNLPLVPFQLLSSVGIDECPLQQKREQTDFENPIRFCNGLSVSVTSAGHDEDKEAGDSSEEVEEEEGANNPINTIVNKPPEKRQRAPSAYNCFIKEEIKRIKGRDPGITHKEAFTAAAKNWAHFPRIQQKRDGECCCSLLGQKNLAGDGAGDDKMKGEGRDIHKKKMARASFE